MPSSEYYRNVYGAMAEGRYQQRHVANQRGNGFFGRIVRGSILPLIKSVLPYIKDVALDGVGGLINDLKEGKTVKEASKNQLKRTSSAVLGDMVKRLRLQTGSGVRRKRKQKGSGLRKKGKRQARPRGRKRRKSRIPGPFQV